VTETTDAVATGQAVPTDELADRSASQLAAAIRRRDVRCADLMAATLARIRRLNPSLNAIVAMLPEDRLMAQAAAADAELDAGQYRGWMHGMPHAVKDLSAATGIVTSFGSRLHADNVAAVDDIHVARLRAAGAIFIGKTNVPEFGLGSQTYNAVYGATRNAYVPTLTAGGSSGGAAVAVATRMLPVADGSDMMGSLRNPAAYNNVVGFRPSQGRVPVTSPDPFYSQLSVNGPIGRTVEDTLRLLATMTGGDRRSPLTMLEPLTDVEQIRPAALMGLRIGWLGDYRGYLATEPGVLSLCEQALTGLTRCGAAVDTAAPDFDLERLWEIWLDLRHWSQLPRQPLLADPERRKLLKPEIVWEIERSLELTAADLSAAAIGRAEWYAALHALFERFDLLALPAAQVFPFPIEQTWPRSIAGRAMDTYHRWMEVTIGASLAGVPAVCLPVGFDAQGRPMGMQFIGPFGADREVLEFALAFERATDFLQHRPPDPG
jgi:amidase